MHKGEETLSADLKKAEKIVKVNGKYYHYKNLDKLYKVLNLAITEYDDEICVIYKALYGEGLIFVRPLKSWLEKVEVNKVASDRFTLVS